MEQTSELFIVIAAGPSVIDWHPEEMEDPSDGLSSSLINP
jgi:hypothetical protein